MLYLILALANAFADEQVQPSADALPARVHASRALLNKLKRKNKMRNILEQMERMCSGESEREKERFRTKCSFDLI